jgi:hypothetical protein
MTFDEEAYQVCLAAKDKRTNQIIAKLVRDRAALLEAAKIACKCPGLEKILGAAISEAERDA